MDLLASCVSPPVGPICIKEEGDVCEIFYSSNIQLDALRLARVISISYSVFVSSSKPGESAKMLHNQYMLCVTLKPKVVVKKERGVKRARGADKSGAL